MRGVKSPVNACKLRRKLALYRHREWQPGTGQHYHIQRSEDSDKRTGRDDRRAQSAKKTVAGVSKRPL